MESMVERWDVDILFYSVNGMLDFHEMCRRAMRGGFRHSSHALWRVAAFRCYHIIVNNNVIHITP